MRPTLFAALAVCCGLALWFLAARTLSLWLDRLHTRQLHSEPVKEIHWNRGDFNLNGVHLDTFTLDTLPSGLTVVGGPGARVSLQYAGKTFPCGPAAADFTFTPDPGDIVTFSSEISHLSWPTTFEMNFMTGSAPTWRRHQYRRLIWTKRSQASLEILWRINQGFFTEGGWRPPEPIVFVTAGLVSVTIHEAVDLSAAVVDYIQQNRHWSAADYRLENRSPSADGAGELVSVIHRGDGESPGTGVSFQLLVGYETWKIVSEIGFQ